MKAIVSHSRSMIIKPGIDRGDIEVSEAYKKGRFLEKFLTLIKRDSYTP